MMTVIPTRRRWFTFSSARAVALVAVVALCSSAYVTVAGTAHAAGGAEAGDALLPTLHLGCAPAQS